MPEIMGLELTPVQKAAQLVHGLVHDVAELMQQRVGNSGGLREGSRQRLEAIVRFRFRLWCCSSFERSKPLREPVFCGPDNCLLCRHITVRTKPVHGTPFVASVAIFGLGLNPNFGAPARMALAM